jgi:putative spermidine/putrescine transport system substrate-binding protein
LAAVVAAVPVLARPAGADVLTIAISKPSAAAALRAAYFEPFTQATGTSVADVTWTGTAAALTGHLPNSNAPWDVVMIGGAELQKGCDAGQLEKLDWSALGGRAKYLDIGVADCGVGAFLTSIVLAWDKQKFAPTPTWADFWDVAKYPGKRGLRAGAETNLEIALLADGVAPGDVYGALRTKDGVERAFRKLDQLKPYIVWWHSDEDAPHLLGSGEVLMTSAPNDQITQAVRTEQRSFQMQWKGALGSVLFWSIVKGTHNRQAADKFLAFVGQPANEAKLLPLMALGGLAKGANDGIPAELAAISPTSPAALADMLIIDEKFWVEKHAELDPRFEAWMSH